MTAEHVAIFVVGFVLGIVAGGFIVLAAPQRGYIPTVPEDVEINGDRYILEWFGKGSQDDDLRQLFDGRG